jgi:hypothetical protein
MRSRTWSRIYKSASSYSSPVPFTKNQNSDQKIANFFTHFKQIYDKFLTILKILKKIIVSNIFKTQTVTKFKHNFKQNYNNL